jgi:feruloyl esterase
MPTTTWNGDFFFTGGSGNDGVVGEAVGTPLGGGTAHLPALYQGFAVVTQNSGHVAIEDPYGNILDVLGDQNNGFGYDPQARNDYGYQQTGTITPVAKSILTAFYGANPLYSYYLGCSNGGREAMMASQRWGDMFDGIVAGDPGFRLPHAAIAEAWDTQQFAAAAQAIDGGADPLDPNGNPSLVAAASPADLALVTALVTQSCDALDGVVDGMIFDTADCKKTFDPATLSQLQCAGAKTPTCLLPQQVTAIQNVFKGPVDSTGNSLYSDWPYDAGIADPKWMMWTIGATLNIPGIPFSIPYVAQNTTQGATSAMYLFSTPPDPSLNVFTASMDSLNTGINAANSTFTQSAAEYMEASSTDLDTFTAHNGKIIYFHGESDPVFSMYDTVNYYESLSSHYGATTQNFARLFLVPGMNHCSGGLHTLDSFDPLTAIVNWVEDGAAPASMIAGNSNPASVPPTPIYTYLPVTRTRPLCPYPQFAQYTGTGSSEDAVNFTCAEPSVGVILSQPKATAPQH